MSDTQRPEINIRGTATVEIDKGKHRVSLSLPLTITTEGGDEERPIVAMFGCFARKGRDQQAAIKGLMNQVVQALEE